MERRTSQLITRRTFFGAAAAGAAALAGASLAGCAPNASGKHDAGNASSADAAPSQETASSSRGANATGLPAPKVFFTSDISPDGIARVFGALEWQASGSVAVKLSTGENGSNYLRPELIGDFVKGLGATIAECNTAYGGDRAGTERHLQLAADHGFTAIADVDIMDADGSASIPVIGGSHLVENLVGSHFGDYDSFVSLAHFKGHAMGGFGGAIKNCSIGIASSEGKALIHNAGVRGPLNWSTPQDDFLESMAEASKSVADALSESIAYINVMNNISVDCDCDTHPAAPDTADIGVLASLDPVALDQACVDLIYAAPDGASVVERIESRNGLHTLEYAEAIGLGSREYDLVDID